MTHIAYGTSLLRLNTTGCSSRLSRASSYAIGELMAISVKQIALTQQAERGEVSLPARSDVAGVLAVMQRLNNPARPHHPERGAQVALLRIQLLHRRGEFDSQFRRVESLPIEQADAHSLAAAIFVCRGSRSECSRRKRDSGNRAALEIRA